MRRASSTQPGDFAIDIALGLLAIFLLTLGTAFFVAGEFALVASDRTRIEHLADEGRVGAAGALKALRDLSFQLSGAQLGITVTSLVVGFIVEPTIGEALEPVMADLGFEDSSRPLAIAVGLILATAVQMVLGELIPKNIAVARPVPMAIALATPLRLVNALAAPVIRFLNATANATVRLLGIEPRDELTSAHSLEELEVMIRSSRRGGSLREEDYALLVRSITFSEKTAADALMPRTAVIAIHKDGRLPELAELSRSSGHSRFPVLDRGLDDIVGIANIKDSYLIAPEDRSETRVADIARLPLFVPESKPLDALLAEMRRDREQMAVVLDEYGGTAGVITLEDLLEEIVGDIEDEHDPAAPPTQETTQISEGLHVLSGLLHPDEVKESCGFEIPEGDYETLGGFLFAVLGRIPRLGDHAAHDGWEFKIIEMDGNRIAKVLVVAPAREEPRR
ncbi:MAG TPA: hemolysin family protein [Actinomycetota bacterium]|nr:hemolysin family protein [Actinomycetota bacterium]